MTTRRSEPRLRRSGPGKSPAPESDSRGSEPRASEPRGSEPRATASQPRLPLEAPRPPLLPPAARLPEPRRVGTLPSLSFLAFADPLPSDYYLG
jgi:hypothetical protein